MISLRSALTIPREKLEKFQTAAHIGGVVAAVLGIVSALLPWSYAHEALDDVTYGGAPSPLQYNYIGLAVVAAVLFAAPLVFRKPGKLRDWVAWNTGARFAGYGLLATGFVAVAAIGIESGGLINVDPGGWIALVAGVIGAVSGLVLFRSPEPSMGRIKTHTIVQIFAIAAGLAAVLFAAAFALDLSGAGGFLFYLTFAAFLALALVRTGAFGWFAKCAADKKRSWCSPRSSWLSCSRSPRTVPTQTCRSRRRC